MILKADRTAVALTVLMILAYPSGATAQDETWKLYDFENTKLMEFDFSVTEDGETRKGSCLLEFEPRGGDQIMLHFKGTLGDASSEFTTTGASDQVYTQAMVQMMMNPAATPLAVTLFAPFWAGFFSGRDMSVGAGWSYSDGTESVSFKVESTCSEAGIDGKKVVWRHGGELKAEACVNVSVPLPLALHLVGDDDEVYDVRMKRYEPN